MNKNAPEIIQLRLDIESNVSRKIRTPYDFEFLAGAIWERLHENLSPTTLKRLWGYIDGADTTRRTTLCLLSQFLGYVDWESYLESLRERNDIQSEAFLGEGIRTEELQAGDLIELTWLPNRAVVIRYRGEMCFEVVKAENAKIHVGDTFSCAFFMVGQPLYIDNLRQGANAPVAYVAGQRTGLTGVRRL